MIKIEPLFATDHVQMRALLRHEAEHLAAEDICRQETLKMGGLTFWQHWLPCQLHMAPSIYVAKEDGVVLGLITLRATGKSKACWQIGNLIVHPLHRGRGVAQELLAFAFALLGSQGVANLVSEVSDQNQAALALFNSCGFRRLSKLTAYELNLATNKEYQLPAVDAGGIFRLALPADKKALFQLHQDILPPNIRYIFAECADDFSVFELPSRRAEKLRQQLSPPKSWFWVQEDPKRHVLAGSVKVTTHGINDYHLEAFVHSAFAESAGPLLSYVISQICLRADAPLLTTKIWEFQNDMANDFTSFGFERKGGFCLLVREHWEKAKYQKSIGAERVLKAIGKPIANIP